MASLAKSVHNFFLLFLKKGIDLIHGSIVVRSRAARLASRLAPIKLTKQLQNRLK